MDRHLDDELKKLNEDLLTMATLTEEAIHKAMEALKALDKDLARDVIIGDERIDEYEISIEEHAIELLALFQPMAIDLRFITTAGMRMNSELEMIADLVVNICQRTVQLSDMPQLKVLVNIPKLGDNAKWMVKSAIDAFVNRDEELAKKVILSDKEVDELRTIIVHELINNYIVNDGTTAPRAIPLILIARDLERMCDHAVAIAQDVIYMLRAKMVRHHPERLESQD
ncbi:MAG: phosphate signaling complex protein PhoU [Candidatus Omnitrophica bacterium]|nr:phosphate signaling complex protein PhoU [Candidatus Omnitrophota bacterium]